MLRKRQSPSSHSLVAYQRIPSLTASVWYVSGLPTRLAEIVTLWMHGRRERGIKRPSLPSKLDNRTLRDIGIPQRSPIEQVVRCCRDC